MDLAPSLIKGEGSLELSKFSKKKGEGSNFSSHENEGVGKIGVVDLKKRSFTYFHANLVFPVLSFSEWLV